jgi:hypothetical protein
MRSPRGRFSAAVAAAILRGEPPGPPRCQYPGCEVVLGPAPGSGLRHPGNPGRWCDEHHPDLRRKLQTRVYQQQRKASARTGG